jgi:hypothetical protein
MSTVVLHDCGVAPSQLSPTNTGGSHFHDLGVAFVRPTTDLTFFRGVCRQPSSMRSSPEPTNRAHSAFRSEFESLPVEVFNQILSYLAHPRSRLPGLTEAQSSHTFPKKAKLAIKRLEDLATPADTNRWALDLFNWNAHRHPFHTLSLTSKHCHELVEYYCSHLVRSCNKFNLPFAHFDQYGSQCVYPDMSGIVYRRLWLQHAPRCCVYCYAVMDCYPFPILPKRVVAACEDCFYRLALVSKLQLRSPTTYLCISQEVDEVERQYHIPSEAVTASPLIRGNSMWVLRTDVEALAFQLYGTRAFHAAHPEQLGKPCSMCTSTNSVPEVSVSPLRETSGQSDRCGPD